MTPVQPHTAWGTGWGGTGRVFSARATAENTAPEAEPEPDGAEKPAHANGPGRVARSSRVFTGFPGPMCAGYVPEQADLDL
ncbi:hypothetical protein GCM10010339_15960 [Streptomyces alanosinicus]|uniref:Uncharacterized protein n=1 Tax=Streptomyces alanosinicus TaxID=68171 RepID=A0A918YE17_9ACTN|nr:hypothetical protein GCM10010339_15960 [Streptomyces alanosinicus]